jgi:hypothetical protein
MVSYSSFLLYHHNHSYSTSKHHFHGNYTTFRNYNEKHVFYLIFISLLEEAEKKKNLKRKVADSEDDEEEEEEVEEEDEEVLHARPTISQSHPHPFIHIPFSPYPYPITSLLSHILVPSHP